MTFYLLHFFNFSPAPSFNSHNKHVHSALLISVVTWRAQSTGHRAQRCPSILFFPFSIFFFFPLIFRCVLRFRNSINAYVYIPSFLHYYYKCQALYYLYPHLYAVRSHLYLCSKLTCETSNFLCLDVCLIEILFISVFFDFLPLYLFSLFFFFIVSSL